MADRGSRSRRCGRRAVSAESNPDHDTCRERHRIPLLRAVEGEFDAVLCMYHDQGLIPLKLHAFHSGVNVTLGLPFPRTSPDHGTAFAIAGKGIARPDSMVAAIRLALELAQPQ